MRSNQVRRYFSSFAYVLVHSLRRLRLEGTELAEAQCDTTLTKLLNVGARETLSSEGYLAGSGK